MTRRRAGKTHEAPTAPATGSQEARLEAAVGSWSVNVPQVNGTTQWRAVMLLDSGLVMSARDGSTELYNPYSDSWRTLMGPSPILSGGTHATVTRLSSGKVLLSGGREGTTRTLLFNPATEGWSYQGHLAEGRLGHTATLLDSGQVLVTGGSYGPRGQRRSVELYEPATGTWSSVQPLPEALTSHAATLLYSGKVLVTGGYHLDIWSHPAAQPRSAAYVFDPATRAWTPAGHMSRARVGHVSIRLYSGSVLVAGGTGLDNSDTSSDVYDPYNDQWLPGPSLPIPGPYASATMLYSGEVLVLNTSGQGALYDPSANAWRLTASTQQLRGYAYAMLLHTGQVLAIGNGAMERFTR
ncbi:kelch repeat-containing protein [Archangium sp.]|uniref:Kelch repeat-containing protein n=1 Tax=Archangium sp. TaxID=1872627 RepID=UPI00286AF7BB|nr:kelch repeat-containing protein [Archangium sp.]